MRALCQLLLGLAHELCALPADFRNRKEIVDAGIILRDLDTTSWPPCEHTLNPHRSLAPESVRFVTMWALQDHGVW